VAAVECRGVVKEFATRSGPVRAVDGIDIDVPAGGIFGILGPNGAGKSTLLRMLHAAFPPTGGTLRVLGHDAATEPDRLKARLGVVPQENNLDPDFTVEKNLTTYARYHGLRASEGRRRADELLAFVGLEEKAREPVDHLSGGMKRRLVLARSLINQPDLLLLDEPTTGLDPQSRHLVWAKVRELRRRGITVLLTTHYLDEAERLCDELVIVDHGRILVRGRPQELIAQHAGRDVLELGFEDDARPHEQGIRALAPDARVEFLQERAVLYVTDADATARRAQETLPVREVLVRRATLEDVFLHLTGRGLRE
jgi:lipooligosaccharide transport system ATP-binding protein